MTIKKETCLCNNPDSKELYAQLKCGKVTIPQSGYRRCSVTKSADQAIPTEQWTSITFDQESYDVGGLHNNSINNARFTIIDAGEYRVCYHVKHEANDKSMYEARVYKNNSDVIEGTCDLVTGSKDSSYLTLKNCSELLSFVFGDYIETQFWHDKDVDQNIMSSNTFLLIERVY